MRVKKVKNLASNYISTERDWSVTIMYLHTIDLFLYLFIIYFQHRIEETIPLVQVNHICFGSSF